MKHSIRHPIQIAGITLVSLILFLGCENPSQSTQEFARISGRIAPSDYYNSFSKTSTTSIEGVAVVVGEIQSNGEIRTVSRDTVYTDARGEFLVHTTVTGTKNLVILATNGGMSWRTIVTKKTKLGQTIHAAPLTIESTVATDVFVRLKMYDESNVMSYADVQAFIDAEVASDAYNDQVAISQLATSIEASIDAGSRVLIDKYGGITEAQWQSIVTAKTEAQADLETALYNAHTQTEIRTALDSFYKAYFDAYTEVGVNQQTCAKMHEIAAQAVIKSSVGMHDSLRFHLVKRVAFLRAMIIDQAVQIRFQALAASDSTMNAVIQTGVELKASVRFAKTFQELRDTFQAYHNTILTLLRLEFNLYASVITNIDASINGEGGTQADLRQSLAATISTSTIIDAYMHFFQLIRSQVETVLQNAGSVEITSVTTILILINVYW